MATNKKQNKKQNRKKPTNTNSNIEVSTYIKYGAIFLLVILIAVAIYFIVKVATKHSNGNSDNPNDPSTTKPSKPVKPAGRIKGAWAGTIGCGDGYFNLISLASALPQDLNESSLNIFLGKVMGNYNSKLSDGNTKYIISVGGSNATTDGWASFFKLLSNNNNSLVPKFVAGLKCRGIVGIDLDLWSPD